MHGRMQQNVLGIMSLWESQTHIIAEEVDMYIVTAILWAGRMVPIL